MLLPVDGVLGDPADDQGDRSAADSGGEGRMANDVGIDLGRPPRPLLVDFLIDIP